MMTAVTPLPLASVRPPRASAGTDALRVAIRPPGAPSGLLDGAWWPYSDDLEYELPFLVAALDRDWGRITRITVNPAHWQPLPHEVRVRGHVVKVGWFVTEQDPHKLLLLSYGIGRLDLLVVPPGTSEAAAARLMAAATDPVGSPTASALIAAENARPEHPERPERPEHPRDADPAPDAAGAATGSPQLTLPLGRMHVSRGRG
jgi:hypothetical protein